MACGGRVVRLSRGLGKGAPVTDLYKMAVWGPALAQKSGPKAAQIKKISKKFPHDTCLK